MKKIKQYLLVFILLFAAGQLLAQQGNVAAGGDASGSGGSMSYSIGQNDFLYFDSGNGNLSFGLQQTWLGETAPLLQNVAFVAGWSSLSSYLVPSASALEDAFAPIADELIIAQTMSGYYYPAENINTIGNWPQHAAFIIKTGGPCTLPITGSIEENKSVVLTTGWNLMPVVANSAIDVEDLFAGFGDALIIVQELAGCGVYWPAMEINSIGALQPGKAYLVKGAEDFVIEFPE
jgi:hypothetical protein